MTSRRISISRDIIQALCLVLLAALPCLLYARTFAFDFVNWDDDLYVYANQVIRTFSFENAWAWFTRPYVGLYVPVPMASYALNYSLNGLDPGSFHAWNVVIHALNTVWVFVILHFFFRDVYLCFLGAVVFALHPVQVEAVAWVSQRKTLLFGFFFLSGFYLVLQGYFAKTRRPWLGAAALLLFLLAILSKVTAVMIPFVLMALVFFYRDQMPQKKWRLPLVLIAPALAAAVVTLVIYPHAAAVFHPARLFERFIPWAAGMFFYFRLITDPSRLDLTYPDPVQIVAGANAGVLTLLGGVFFILILVLGAFKKRKSTFWLFWIFLMLLPASNLIQAPAADRHLYIPLVGVIGLLLVLAKNIRLFAILGFAFWIVYMIPLTSARIDIWQNSETLWRSVRAEDGSARFNADMQLAGYYEDQGRFAEAASLYLQVIHRRPSLPYPYFNAYNLYQQLERHEKASEIAALFTSQYSTAHRLEEVYPELLRRRRNPSQVEAYIDEVMRESHFGLPENRRLPS